MSHLGDLLERLRRGLKLQGPQLQVLGDRFTPTLLLADLTDQYARGISEDRVWAASSAVSAVAAERAQVQVQVPIDSEVVSIVDAIWLFAGNPHTVIAAFRPPNTAVLAVQTASQFRDRRGVRVTSTGIETSTLVSQASAAAIGISRVFSFRVGGGAGAVITHQFPLGVILGPGDNIFFQSVSDNEDLNWGVVGRERPWRSD